DRARVGRGEEVQVLAVAIEDRFAHFAQTVGDGERFVLIGRVDVDRLDVGRGVQGVRQPFRIGRPGGRQRVDRGVQVLAGDLLRRSALQIGDVDAVRVVDIRNLLAIRRPHGRLVETGAAGLVVPAFAFAVLRRDDQFVFSRFVGEKGDRLAVGRPRRRSLVDPDAVRQVAGVAFLGGNRDDFAAEFEYRAR